jgi:hypothetical protein
MALQAKVRMMVGMKSGMASTPLANYPQKSSATFIDGAPVKLTSNYLDATAAESSTTGANNVDLINKSSTDKFLGIALGTAVSGITSNIVVAEFRPGTHFVGNLVADVQANAKVSKVGSTVYFGQDDTSDTHWGWSVTAPSSSAASYVQGIVTTLIDPASTINGRVGVRVTVGNTFTGL